MFSEAFQIFRLEGELSRFLQADMRALVLPGRSACPSPPHNPKHMVTSYYFNCFQ